jgi:hypothetical protein
MEAPLFHLYSGHSKDDGVHIEAIRGIGNAYELMTKVAAQSPGSYFILSTKTNAVCGSIDTSKSLTYLKW